MTYPTDAQIEAAIRAYVIEKYGTWGYDYWEDAIAEMPRAPIRAAILAADRAAWVTDGSVPDHTKECFTGWLASDGTAYLTRDIVAWREIIGPEDVS